ncbi:MAG: hypothetical protein JXB48_21130 [Candidatus Latescibacteria bacterium]|nr:hypothetical protein [Candidatus Latescibacterota bacterium]
MIKEFLKAIFCVEENGEVRPSLTKTGAAFKYFSISIGGAITGLTFISNNPKATMTIAICTAVLSSLGAFFEKVGERNAMEKK